MQDGVKRARADAVAMTGEFFARPEAKHDGLSSVMKDMQANEAGVKITIINNVTETR